jgi:hypothetical protein
MTTDDALEVLREFANDYSAPSIISVAVETLAKSREIGKFLDAEKMSEELIQLRFDLQNYRSAIPHDT